MYTDVKHYYFIFKLSNDIKYYRYITIMLLIRIDPCYSFAKLLLLYSIVSMKLKLINTVLRFCIVSYFSLN